MKENSIEEDIKILKELGQKYYKNGEIKIKALSGAKYIWALQNLLSDYKRVLKENELLRKDIESWNKYYEEIEEEQIEMSNKNCELEFEVEELQKENEELEEINNELEAEKNEAIRRYNFETIPIQKIKDKIKEIDKKIKYEENEKVVIYLHKQKNILQELLESEEQVMNEEEKKAIKMLDKFITEHKFYNIKHSDNLEDNTEIVLNLIEKLQKENEELKNQEATARKINELLVQRYSNSIPVEKVKDKIEELNNISNAEKLEDTMIGENYTITELVQYVLQKLIEEREEK